MFVFFLSHSEVSRGGRLKAPFQKQHEAQAVPNILSCVRYTEVSGGIERGGGEGGYGRVAENQKFIK